jgi:hypothetical protein
MIHFQNMFNIMYHRKYINIEKALIYNVDKLFRIQ